MLFWLSEKMLQSFIKIPIQIDVILICLVVIVDASVRKEPVKKPNHSYEYLNHKTEKIFCNKYEHLNIKCIILVDQSQKYCKCGFLTIHNKHFINPL